MTTSRRSWSEPGLRVAAELPPLDEIFRRLPAPVRRVELFACPDALGMAGTAEPHVFVDGDDAIGGAGASRLMVRRAFPEGPLMLPRPIRCRGAPAAALSAGPALRWTR
ncbi:hypothetical protein predicted by Glimmer/Critica [Sorangium cellulosum So ce56]|uniref:Uncharacterized protein n=1 Tax=Sorangium cellulosum (strain So ce56) TaxID=448385 RepID=A9FDA2_SORC5|nr:hypothetical protein [Sorangium cellulosum]CAN91742.1 hypothetical protein predicted by Glimmer/Critica [Sorangium cellulosum So ce56]